MQPLVSILIPAFNAESSLAETVHSAMRQTWARKEVIIVVDEGCSDDTIGVARKLASKEVLVVARPHQTAAGARNDAFRFCQGDYIQWLDADDLLAPDKIHLQMRQVQQCQNPRLLMSGPWGHFLYRTSRAKFQPTGLWCDLSPEEWIIRKMGDNLHMQPGTWLASRALTELIGAWDVRLIDEDGEYFNRLVLASDGIKFVPNARVYYRQSVGSFTARARSQMEGRLLSIQLQLAQLRSLGETDRVRAAYLNYLTRFSIYFHPERPDMVAKLRQFAAEVGGELKVPNHLGWKYAWLCSLFGYEFGKRAQSFVSGFKFAILRAFDKRLLFMDRLRRIHGL